MKENLDFFYDKLIEQYGKDLFQIIMDGLSKKRITTLRVNTLKSNSLDIENVFKTKGISYEKVSWYKDAFILNNQNEDDIKKLDIYNDGKIYLQSLSSMLPVLILNPFEESILDMAAAPGSKTSQIAALSNNKSLITAIEKNKIRCERLKYNIQKQGAKKITILNEDARKLDDFYSFDKILLDSPCSGSGTLYLENVKNFDNDLIQRCKKTQYELLEKAVKLLKVGGTIIYSTCSILKEENEEIVTKILTYKNLELIPIEKDLFQNIPLLPSMDGTITVMPTKTYEGFFIAKIRKIK